MSGHHALARDLSNVFPAFLPLTEDIRGGKKKARPDAIFQPLMSTLLDIYVQYSLHIFCYELWKIYATLLLYAVGLIRQRFSGKIFVGRLNPKYQLFNGGGFYDF